MDPPAISVCDIRDPQQAFGHIPLKAREGSPVIQELPLSLDRSRFIYMRTLANCSACARSTV
jgi:hypothetical protein